MDNCRFPAKNRGDSPKLDINIFHRQRNALLVQKSILILLLCWIVLMNNIVKDMVKLKKLLEFLQKMIFFNHIYQSMILDHLIIIKMLDKNYTFSI